MHIKHSSAELAKPRFRAHGQFETESEDNILITSATGPFNTEFINALFQVRQVCFNEMQIENKVGSILVFHESMMIAADALEVYRDKIKQQNEALKASLVIAFIAAGNVEGRNLMLPLFANIFKNIDITWKSFEDLETARAWVSSTLNLIN